MPAGHFDDSAAAKISKVLTARLLLLLFLFSPVLALAQANFRVYTAHPRLWLESRRLSRLQKDTDRGADRWEHLQRLLAERFEFAEMPLVHALIYQVRRDETQGRAAIDWAMATAGSPSGFAKPADLRLGALVFDWCFELLSDEERKTIAAALGKGVEPISGQSGLDVGAVRSAVMAAVATADDWDGSEKALEQLMGRRWESELLPALKRGELTERGFSLLAVVEICHTVRQNLDRDLFLEAPQVFKPLPMVLMLRELPLPFETKNGLFHQPALPTTVAIDRELEAVLIRIAEMALVAYENTWGEYQFLQGWLRHDPYTLRLPLGAPYEFLWLNPYLPGLSYFSAPSVIHDEVGGRIFARQGWQDDDLWVGYLGGQLQIFADGEVSVIPRSAKQAPLIFPEAALVYGEMPMDFRVDVPDGQAIYVLGLGEGQEFEVRINRSKPMVYTASRGGILVLDNRPDKGTLKIDFEKPVRAEIRPVERKRPSLK